MREFNEVKKEVVIQCIKLYHCEMPTWYSMNLEFNGH